MATKTATKKDATTKAPEKPIVLNSMAALKSVISQAQKDATATLTAIVNFLKDKDVEVVQKKNYYEARKYRFTIHPEHGFMIKDMMNYGKVPEKWDTENLLPTPKEVYDFIVRPIGTFSKNQESKEPIEKTTKKVLVLQKGETLKPVIPVTPAKTEMTKEQLEANRKKGIFKVRRIKDVDKMINEVYDLFDHRGFRINYNKLIRAYRTNKLRYKKFLTLVEELINTSDFSEKKLPAPKFPGVQWYNITELFEGEKVVTFKTTDNKVTLELTKSDFLAKYVLHTWPEMMPQMMKFIKGEISYDDFIDNPIKKDRFVHYESKLLVNNDELYRACVRLLQIESDQQPLLVAFNNHVNNELKKGDYIKVQYQDWCTEWTGRVIDTVGGIEVMYSDGGIEKLLKHQRWIKVPKPDVKNVEKN